jgi:hypothetical protein
MPGRLRITPPEHQNFRKALQMKAKYAYIE